MTTVGLSDTELAAIAQVPCPRCRAPRHMPCVARARPHKDRLDTAALHRVELRKLRDWNQGGEAATKGGR